ncbi:arylsulfatase B [Patella vulgata]|uniref:arylsulfatase B n=1 Tax=Patella vulgata TaxID=6465 RepID=UPI0024A7C9DA|nr:arylsulfatase B [Patella vulgata]
MLNYVLVLSCLTLSLCLCDQTPHIVFVLADDLGWNDLGFHNPAMITPTLDKFAKEGVIFNNSYVQPMCTPSRSAFMTGYYPFHTGLQHKVIDYWQPNYLQANYTILPQYLKKRGYATHIVGKWHLGFCNWKYVPTRRGFDTFYGYYQGCEGHFNRTIENGYDFRDNDTVAYLKGEYSTKLFADRAIQIIENHDPSIPLFLYLPFQNVHFPIEVPKQYENMYSNIHDNMRRVYSGMVSAMDEAFGNITAALERKGLTNNLLLGFTSDNGGPIGLGANNLPLRGGKTTIWEGGTRGISFAHSKTLIKKTGYTHNGLMHAIDWFSTFLEVAGLPQPAGIDGISQWKMWRDGAPSERLEVVHNIDNIANNSAIRDKQYKLILGNPGPGPWDPLPKLEDTEEDFEKPDPLPDTLLYDLIEDPGEHNNLVDELPDVVNRLKARLDYYKSTAIPARFPPNTPAGDPNNFGGVWGPGWC